MRRAGLVLGPRSGYTLLGMTMHDGLLASFNGKFLYGLWRPVTAIREAERDGNPDTAADPTWLSLLPTPPYPAYPGNMTCLGSVGSRTLERLFGRNDLAFSVTWTGTGTNADITRPFNGSASWQMNRRAAGSMAGFTSRSIRTRALARASRWPITRSTTTCANGSASGGTSGCTQLVLSIQMSHVRRPMSSSISGRPASLRVSLI